MPILVSISLISGCTVVPGMSLPTSDKTVIKQDDYNFDISKFVNVFPLTPQLVAQLQPKAIIAQSNSALDKELQNYQYRVGVGDVLNVTVCDHPELTTPAGQY